MMMKIILLSISNVSQDKKSCYPLEPCLASFTQDFLQILVLQIAMFLRLLNPGADMLEIL